MKKSIIEILNNINKSQYRLNLDTKEFLADEIELISKSIKHLEIKFYSISAIIELTLILFLILK